MAAFADTAFATTAFATTAFDLEAADLVTVPDVVGQDQASATAELEAVLFVVGVSTDYSSTVPAGNVISQSPTAGSEAVEGSTVTINVSLGDRPDTGGGRPKRRHLYVEVDGQQFPVNNATEALQILQKARALAERQAEEEARLAEKRVKRAIKKRGADVPQIRVPAPSITVSPEFKADTAALIADIDRLYKQAAMHAEMRMLLAKKQADDDEEDDLMLLL